MMIRHRPEFPAGSARRFAAGLLIFLLAGCATPEGPASAPAISGTRLIAARAGPEVTLTWQSRKAARYTVFYADNPAEGTRWEPLPGHIGLAGTGGTMSGHDRVPEHVDRRYKLNTVEP